MEQYAALFWKQWTPGENSDEIVGHWAEDDSEYTVRIPEQLRDHLISIQNLLARRHEELTRFRKAADEFEEECRRLLPSTRKDPDESPDIPG